MFKDDTSLGLLSKVVKFVRHSATSWSDLDYKETNRDEALSRQLLKEMIERKRRNDFVRKREFDMLRKIRKQEASVRNDLSVRPSFFQNSTPSKLDDRANTIKKIDEIEAQMSMQWWKTKNGHSNDDSVHVSSFLPSRTFAASAQSPSHREPFLANALPGGYAITENSSLEQVAQGTKKESASLARKYPPPFLPALSLKHQQQVPKVEHTFNLAPVTSRFELERHAGPALLTNIEPSNLASSAGVCDAELEEASICFANGDDAGAEAGLLRMLVSDGIWHSNIQIWMTLFDFYRATDQQYKFENKALEFVQYFERSAPQWFSMPEMVGQLVKPAVPTNGHVTAADWICPSAMGFQTVVALKAAIAKASMPWRIDWSHLKTIELEAVKPLCAIFNNWATLPVQLRFIGNTQLRLVIEKAASVNQRQVAQEWWYLLMAVLRVTNQPDDFELVALDFCVTYEVSPPAWESARCEYKPLDLNESAANGLHVLVGEVTSSSTPSRLSAVDGDTEMAGLSHMSDFFSIELSGQIQGDVIEVLHQLEAKLKSVNGTTISCANLIRVDFSAAGTLLNWVSTRQAENKAVRFTDVNRLVAAFFHVIGIAEHAQLSLRTD